jgi:hypothetical protein
MSTVDPDLIKILLAAGILPEIATDRELALADTLLARNAGSVSAASTAMQREMKRQRHESP